MIELLDLREIYERWGATENRIYAAAARGEIHAYGRPGRQKYYALRELVDLLGEPNYPRGLNSNRQARSGKGGNQRSFEFAVADAA